MGVVAALVFIAVFAVSAPLLIWSSGAHKVAQKEKVVAVLDSAIGQNPAVKKHDPLKFRKDDLVSAIPVLNKHLEKLYIIPRLRTLLTQADVKWTPGAVILMCAAAFAIPAYLLSAYAHLGGRYASAAFVLGGAPVSYLLFKRKQRFGKFEGGLPEALDLMVNGLRAGHSLSSAMGLVTRECPDPIGSEFRIAYDEQNFGLDLRSALDNLVTRVPIPDMKIAVTAILIQRESGGNLAEVLEKTAHMIRQRFKLKRQIRVLTASGRLSGWILTFLPIALGVGLYFLNPSGMSLLWTTEMGRKMLIYATCSIIVGSVVIQKIVRMKV
jgi:tight adherence protein B